MKSTEEGRFSFLWGLLFLFAPFGLIYAKEIVWPSDPQFIAARYQHWKSTGKW